MYYVCFLQTKLDSEGLLSVWVCAQLRVSVSEQEVMDLDMLDNDFQQSVLSSVDDKPSSSSKASAGRPADPASRKR